MANTLEDAGKGAVSGAGAGAAIGSLLSPIGTVAGANIGTALGALGGALGLGTGAKKVMRDDASTWGNKYQRVPSNIYNKYNDLVKQWNADNPNQYTEGGSTRGTYAVKKSTSRGHKTNYYGQYGINMNTGNQAVDQYANYLLGGGTQGATDWVTGKRTDYSNAMKDAAKSAVSGYIDPYRQSQQDSVNSSLNTAFEEAKAKLDAQKAYGYLSDVGYQKALDKLMNQRGSVQSGMNDVYNAQISNWENNLNDMYNTAISGIKGWDWVNPFDVDGGEYAKQNALAKNYAQNSINQDILNSLMSDANTFTPEEWIAYGAGNQGQYNPFIDFTPTSRKKRTTSTEGINEV